MPYAKEGRWTMPVLVSWLALLCAAVPAQGGAGGFADFDAYLAKTMQDWGVPGLAVALVKDDQVVFMKGFGVREAGTDRRVNEDTVFPIGSMSKSFTSAAIALLVQDGRLSWDDRVIDRLPGFQMSDPWVTREITVRDLLANRSGLSGSSELLWYATDHSRDALVRRLRFVGMESSFRSQFGYRNLMFLTAGQIIPAVTGMSWDAFVKARLFAPLGMTRSSTSVRDIQGSDNVVTPHRTRDGRVVPIPFRNLDNIGPAGSINASIRDMAQWLRFQMSNGMHDGIRVAEAAVIGETHRPHTPLTPEWQSHLPWARRADYCLAWVLIDRAGDLSVYHTGTIDGIHAAIGFIPDKRVGAVLLTNRESTYADALFLRAMDVLLGREGQDWSALSLDAAKKLDVAAARALEERAASRVQGTRPSLPLAAYAGTYENDAYGRVAVALEGDRLVLHFSSLLVGDLAHWHYDTFQAKWRDRVAGDRVGTPLLSFSLDATGRVSKLDMEGVLLFERLPDSGANGAK